MSVGFLPWALAAAGCMGLTCQGQTPAHRQGSTQAEGAMETSRKVTPELPRGEWELPPSIREELGGFSQVW